MYSFDNWIPSPIVRIRPLIETPRPVKSTITIGIIPCSGSFEGSIDCTRRIRNSSTSPPYQRPHIHITMEASSPLAAMQQSSFMPSWGLGGDMYTSHPHAHLSNSGFGPGAFNFRDLSMKRSSKPDYYSSKPDYFQIKPVRGSSPTASLAADLSQNFHIDIR